MNLGLDGNGREVFVPFSTLLPMVAPTALVFGGWDISSLNLAEVMRRTQVLNCSLQEQLWPYMENLHPGPLSTFLSSPLPTRQHIKTTSSLALVHNSWSRS